MGCKIKVFNLFMYNIATEECIYVFNEQFSSFCIVVVYQEGNLAGLALAAWVHHCLHTGTDTLYSLPTLTFTLAYRHT